MADSGAPTRRPSWLRRLFTFSRSPKGVLKAIGVGLVTLFLALLLIFGVFYAATPIPDPNSEFKTENTTLFYRDGKEVLGTLSVQNRQSIPYAQMPQNVKDAMVAAENMTFWRDPGIDIGGMMRAVTSLVGPGETVGGSTITQQYVKVLYLSQEKTITRKAKELVLALKVGNDLSKEQILEGYLNTVYFGRGAYGIQAAAQTYFGIDAAKLNEQQAIALASIVNAPNLLDPTVSAKQSQDLLERYQMTINHLVEMGKLTEADKAKIYGALPPFPKVEKDARFGGPKGFLMTMAQAELRDQGFTDAEISGGGLKVTTTFDSSMQAAAVDAAQSMAKSAASERGKKASDLHPGIASVDTATGGILALYGGPDFVASNKNWATTPRPTGSTFKPYALIAALRHGFSLSDTFNGTSFTPRGANKPIRNAGGESFGPITMQDATTHSVNSAFVDIVSQIPDGPNQVIKAAGDAGVPVNDSMQPVLSIPLGFGEVSPVYQALAYSTFANEGVRREAHVIAEVRDQAGNVVYKPTIQGTQAIEKDVAINAAYAMTKVTQSGTGQRVAALGRQVAGKTGTRYDSDKNATVASWFVGSTKQISTAVMFVAGDDGNGNLDSFSSGFYGSGYPARTWLAYMRQAMKGLPDESFSGPVRMSSNAQPTRQYVPVTRTPTSTSTRTARQTASASAAPTSASAQPSASPTRATTSAQPTQARPTQTRTTGASRPTQTSGGSQPSGGGADEPGASSTP